MSRRGAIALGATVLAVVVAACGGTSIGSPAATSQPGGSPLETAPSGASAAPSTSAAPGPTAEPAASPEPTPPAESPATEPPGPSGTPVASGAGETPAAAAGAEACSGSAENRDFFSAAAESFSWDVYCAALPDGWFVETGSYRLADGGRLVVAYRGPDGSRVELQEGAYCTEGGSACSPRDHEIGPAAFGDRTGTLVTLGPAQSDGFAIYVDPGAAPSWSITGTGMDQDAFTAIAAALVRVARGT